jgi:hypothetical protein
VASLPLTASAVGPWQRLQQSPGVVLPLRQPVYAGETTRLDDSALLSRWAEMRAELERLPPSSPGHAALTALYDLPTEEVKNRARKA